MSDGRRGPARSALETGFSLSDFYSPTLYTPARLVSRMRLNRISCPGPLDEGTEAALPPAGAYHVARVLRMREGAPLVVFDGTGGEYRAEIIRIQGDAVT